MRDRTPSFVMSFRSPIQTSQIELWTKNIRWACIVFQALRRRGRGTPLERIGAKLSKLTKSADYSAYRTTVRLKRALQILIDYRVETRHCLALLGRQQGIYENLPVLHKNFQGSSLCERRQASRRDIAQPAMQLAASLCSERHFGHSEKPTLTKNI